MSGSVSLVNGHIDSDKNEMTPQEALDWVEDYEKVIKEEQAIVNNGDEFHVEALKVCEVVKQALEKQIPKKLDGKDEDDLVCGCHKCGEVNALWKMNGDRNRYCGNCGQAIDWGDIE